MDDRLKNATIGDFHNFCVSEVENGILSYIYTNPSNCAMSRFLKSLGFINVNVAPGSVLYLNNDSVYYRFPDKVEKCLVGTDENNDEILYEELIQGLDKLDQNEPLFIRNFWETL